MADATYIKGAELDDVALTWSSPMSGLYTDFVSGWTFTARIGHVNATALITKSTGFTPASTPPNLVIAWAAGELDVLAPDTYEVDVEAKNTGSNKDRITRFTLEILERVNP
jgi:hypothetical protein